MQVHGQGTPGFHRDAMASKAVAAHALDHQGRIDGECRGKGIAEGFEEPQGDRLVDGQFLIFFEGFFQGIKALRRRSPLLERGSVDQRAAFAAFAGDGIPAVHIAILMVTGGAADGALIVLHVMNVGADGDVVPLHELGEGKCQFLAVLAGERLALGQDVLQSAAIFQIKLPERAAGDCDIGVIIDVRFLEEAAGNPNGAAIKVNSSSIAEIAAGDCDFTAVDGKVPNGKRIAEVEGQLAAICLEIAVPPAGLFRRGNNGHISSIYSGYVKTTPAQRIAVHIHGKGTARNEVPAVEPHSFQQLEGNFPGALLCLVEGGGGIHKEFGLAIDRQGGGGRLFTNGADAVLVPLRVGADEAAGAFADIVVIVGSVLNHDQVAGIVFRCIAVYQAASGGSRIVLGEGRAVGEVRIYTAYTSTALDAIEQNYALVQDQIAAADANRIASSAVIALENDAGVNGQRTAAQGDCVSLVAIYPAGIGGAGDGHVAAIDLELCPACCHTLPVQVDGDAGINGYSVTNRAVLNEHDRAIGCGCRLHSRLKGFIVFLPHHGHHTRFRLVGIQGAAVDAVLLGGVGFKGVGGALSNGVSGCIILRVPERICHPAQVNSFSVCIPEAITLCEAILYLGARINCMECSACNILANVLTSIAVNITVRYQIFYFTAGDIQLFRDAAINLFVGPTGDGQGGVFTVDIASHLAALCGTSHRQACAAFDVDGTIQDVPVQVDGEDCATGLLINLAVRCGVSQQSDGGPFRRGSSFQGVSQIVIIGIADLCHGTIGQICLAAVLAGFLGNVIFPGMGITANDGQGLAGGGTCQLAEFDGVTIFLKAVALRAAVPHIGIGNVNSMERAAGDVSHVFYLMCSKIQRVGTADKLACGDRQCINGIYRQEAAGGIRIGAAIDGQPI